MPIACHKSLCCRTVDRTIRKGVSIKYETRMIFQVLSIKFCLFMTCRFSRSTHFNEALSLKRNKFGSFDYKHTVFLSFSAYKCWYSWLKRVKNSSQNQNLVEVFSVSCKHTGELCECIASSTSNPIRKCWCVIFAIRKSTRTVRLMN